MDVRIGIVSALARIDPTGVNGYGGIERATYWMACELARRGHEVLLFGNVDNGPAPDGWTGVHLITENDVLTPKNYELLVSCDAVSDWTHGKPARWARTKRYFATTMWTDVMAERGRNIYPSEAVRAKFNEPRAPVIPIGLPIDRSHTDLEPHDAGWVCFGRVAVHKGTDLSIGVARECGVSPFTVAGHVWPGIDEYYSLMVAQKCREAGFTYKPDAPNDTAARLLHRASGLLHLHRWLESFSIVAAEALCHGVPILTTDTGAPQEWVRHTDGGLVVPLKDLEAKRPEALAIARAFFETKWEGRREGIAKRARELFDVRLVAERYLALFESPPPK